MSFSSSSSYFTAGVVDQSSSSQCAKALDVISPERKDAFCEFVLSLPRKCSPTICGIIQPQSMNETLLQTESFREAFDEEGGEVPMETSSLQVAEDDEDDDDGLNEDDRQLISNGNSTTANSSSGGGSVLKDSIWSIDEYSELYGGDFDNLHELEHFHEYESEQLSTRLDNESRLFFSQASINPSPVAERSSRSQSGEQEEEEEDANKENMGRRSTASFIRYIDTLESMKSGKANQMATSACNTPTNKDQSATDFDELEEQQQQQDQLDSGNFHETTTTTTTKRTPCKQMRNNGSLHYQQYQSRHHHHSKMSFTESLSDAFDSDVFSGTATTSTTTATTTTMDISFEQSTANLSSSALAAISSSGGGLILSHRCGGLSHFESHSLQIQYNEYFDFSPISPISRRTPQRSIPTAAGGGGGRAAAGAGNANEAHKAATSATRTTPLYSAGGRSAAAIFKTPSSKQRVLQRTKLFNDQAFESTPTTDRLNF